MDQFSQAGRAEAVMPGQERLGRGLVGGLPQADVHRINVTAEEKASSRLRYSLVFTAG